MNNEELFRKAYDLWNSFKQEVLYRNRFIVNHEVLEYLKCFAHKNKMTIEKDKTLYRARLYTGDDIYFNYLDNNFNLEGLDTVAQLSLIKYKYDIESRNESGFWGYGKKESYIPPNSDLISDGRTNPAYIGYLYTAEQPYTALVEVRPYLNSKVSVAEIKVNESLTLADFSYESFKNFDDEFELNLIYLIMNDFSRPVDSDKKNYIPTQYISEHIKTLGFEGIRFNSSLHGTGRNITIFNYEKCQPVGSKLYKIEDICFEAKGIAPKFEKDLIHYKLEPFKKNQLKSFLSKLKPNSVLENQTEKS